jgi:hypothetical protein
MIGWNWIRGRGPSGWSIATAWCPLRASIASRHADSWPTWTRTRIRYGSSRGTRSTPALGGGIAPRDRRHSPKSPILTACSSHSSARATGGKGSGCRSVGTRRWTRLGRGAGQYRGADPSGDHGATARRTDVPRGAPGRRRFHRTDSRCLGGRRAQLSHQRVLVQRPGGIPILDGVRPAEPGFRKRKGDGAGVGTPGSPTRPPTPTTGWRPIRDPSLRCCSPSPTT